MKVKKITNGINGKFKEKGANFKAGVLKVVGIDTQGLMEPSKGSMNTHEVETGVNE